jgi:hypothetical protein
MMIFLKRTKQDEAADYIEKKMKPWAIKLMEKN